MPSFQKISSDYDFDVQKLPLRGPDSQIIKGLFGTFREGVSQPLGVVSDRYKVVNYRDVIGGMDDAIEKASSTNKAMADVERSVSVIGNGERMRARYRFPNLIAKVPKVGDEIALVLEALSSHDRSNRLKFLLGGERLVCTNGQTSIEKQFSISRLHSNRLDIGFIADAVQKAASKFEESLKVFGLLADAMVTQEQGRTVIKNLGFTKPVREGIETVWNDPTHTEDSERNLYNVYNATTQFLTENETMKKRVEYAADTNRDVLGKLNKAARTPDYFSKLLIMPVDTETVVNVEEAVDVSNN